MERITVRYISFVKALDSLKEVIAKFKALEKDDYYYKELRDSIIQRFEYSVDTLWKLLKDYIEKNHGIQSIGSPKLIFKICLDIKLVDENEYEECIRMIDYRNLTSHAYDATLAEEISHKIPEFFKAMEIIYSRLPVI